MRHRRIDRSVVVDLTRVDVWLMDLWKCLGSHDACVKMLARIQFQISRDSRSDGASVGVARRTRRPWRKWYCDGDGEEIRPYCKGLFRVSSFARCSKLVQLYISGRE